MFWTLSKALVYVQVAFVYVLCVYHLWRFAFGPINAEGDGASIRQTCVDKWKHFREFLCRWRKPNTGPLSRATQETMAEFRLEQSEQFARATAHFIMFMLITVAIYVTVYSDSLYPEWPLRYGMYMLIYVVLLAVATGKVKLTIRRLDVMHVCFQFFLLVLVVVNIDTSTFFEGHSLRAFLRLAVGILYLDAAKSIPFMMFYSIVSCWRYHDNISILVTDGDRTQIFYFLELFLCAGTIVVCCVVQAWLEARFRGLIIAQNQKRATFKLAAYKSDATFWLAPDLRLDGPSPQLASLLLLADTPNHLDGKPFENYIASDSDRQRFRDFIATSTLTAEHDGLPSLSHLDLRDSTGRAFPVEAFHTCFVDGRDQTGHLIGISETAQSAFERRLVAEEQAEELAADAIQSAALDRQRAPSEVGQAMSDVENVYALASVSECGAAPNATMNPAPPALVPLFPEHVAFAPICFLLDDGTGEILGCTAGFATLVGPLRYRTRARDIVINYVAFARWMQGATNSYYHNEAFNDPLAIVLAQPTYRRRFQVHAEAHVVDVEFDASVSSMVLRRMDEDRELGALVAIELRNPKVQCPDKERDKRQTNTATNEQSSGVMTVAL